jgi:hypothetical protein
VRPARKPARSVVGSAGRGSRSWAEELPAVAAAEQKDEPLQVTVQFVQAVGGVASELFQRGAEAAGAHYSSAACHSSVKDDARLRLTAFW